MTFDHLVISGEKMSVSNTMFTTPDSYANVAMGFPELEFSASEVISWERPPVNLQLFGFFAILKGNE